MSARAIARELEAQKLPTPKGGAWHAATVLRIMKRLERRNEAPSLGPLNAELNSPSIRGNNIRVAPCPVQALVSVGNDDH